MSNTEILAQLEAIRGDQAALSERGQALFDQLVCECCGGKDEIGIRPIMYKGPICKHCFFVWYEYGLQDSEKIREKSLQIQQIQERAQTVKGDA